MENPYSAAWNCNSITSYTSVCCCVWVTKNGARAEISYSNLPRTDAACCRTTAARVIASFRLSARFRFQEGRNIFLSYVRSQARGNLNDFNTYFGNLKHAVIRPDEYGKQPFDAPNRLLFWGDFGLPFDFVADAGGRLAQWLSVFTREREAGLRWATQ